MAVFCFTQLQKTCRKFDIIIFINLETKKQYLHEYIDTASQLLNSNSLNQRLIPQEIFYFQLKYFIQLIFISLVFFHFENKEALNMSIPTNEQK